MKKGRKAEAKFREIKKQYPELKRQVEKAKNDRLWHQEAMIRSRIKALGILRSWGFKDYRRLYDDYTGLLEKVSVRLLDRYNRSNDTDYRFGDVVSGNFSAYLSAGIISVLVTDHIPKKLAQEFARLLPSDPKDEYPAARKMKRKFFLHLGETNTGKTYDALQRLKSCGSGVYLSPLRILALEVFERLNGEGVPCSLLTGEEEIKVEGAAYSSRTVEKADIQNYYEAAVIDEVQMIGDARRGDAWTRAVLGLRCPEIHLCGALTAKDRLVRMIESCGDEYEIKEYTRLTPLRAERRRVKLSDARPGDAFVAFSRKGVLSLSGYFTEHGMKNSVIYGDLPPEVRRAQYASFISGENPVLVSTDAIGMGVNLPIRRIVFTETRKFDGEQFRLLTSQEIKQIAGRAGRIGIYDVGYVACAEDGIDFIENRLEEQDEAIDSAVVGPSEAILEIGLLPLREKLALWSTREESVSRYRKKDVRDYLLVLDRLRHFGLPEKTQWKLMALPFDVNSDEMMMQFISFAEECFTLKAEELTKPVPLARTLSRYEEYYQKINLYYSFSKAMGMDFDEAWVYETRKSVSDEINRLL